MASDLDSLVRELSRRPTVINNYHESCYRLEALHRIIMSLARRGVAPDVLVDLDEALRFVPYTGDADNE